MHFVLGSKSRSNLLILDCMFAFDFIIDYLFLTMSNVLILLSNYNPHFFYASSYIC